MHRRSHPNQLAAKNSPASRHHRHRHRHGQSGASTGASSPLPARERTRPPTRPGARIASAHPLAADFSASLRSSTDAIAARLSGQLSDAHETRLSRLAAATVCSRARLLEAAAEKRRLGSLGILSAGFVGKAASFGAFVAEKELKLAALWDDYRAVTQEILDLRREATGIDAMDLLRRRRADRPADAAGFMEEVVASVRGVGSKWAGQMEENESKLVEDTIKKKQAAYTFAAT